MLASVLKWLLRRRSAPATVPTPGKRPPAQSGGGWLGEALHLHKLGRHAEAVAGCRSVLAREHDNTDALQLLAAALLAQGESREGVACLRRVTELQPDSAEALANLAAVLANVGDLNGAIDGYHRALRLRADWTSAWNALATLLKTLGRYDEAEQCCRSGLQADDRDGALHHTLSGVLFEQGYVDGAIAEVRTALALAPDQPAAHSDLVRMLNYSDAPDPLAVYREHSAWAERHARALEQAAPPHHDGRDRDRRLRIGFVSPYFRKHAMTFFFESVVEHHDREKMEIILYADVAQPDEYSERLKAHGAAWRKTVGMSDEELARTVRNDAIDVLVDLSGHTPYNRLLAFARRPAPVQVTWNGYPNTTGMASMDYRITDAYCDPPGTTEHLHSEKLVRLPDVYMTWRPPQEAPDTGPLPALGSGCVTFASFNSCFKITPALTALWSRILREVPGSRLLLLTVNGIAAARRIRDLFAANGVAPGRLEFLPRMTHEEFLATHQRADIALDTFPYHGTTTTCFSLWMGLPVVTLAGTTHASRVGVSILNNLGLPQLVAGSGEDYCAIAKRLAGDLPALAELRASLRRKMQRSPLTDGRRGASALEQAFREMWATWCGRRGSTGTGGPAPASPNARNIVIRSEYGPVIVNRFDTMIGTYTGKDGGWEKDEIELLRWFMTACYGSEPEVEILDIGAYNGVYTIALARFPFPRVTVHAFEAQREIFSLLTGTVALNGLDNVHCYHKAVSSESGKIIHYQAVDYDTPANFGSLEIDPAVKPDFDGKRLEGMTESVETIGIDDVGLEKVRLMKIDAEGMEHKVLAGAAGTIRRCRPLIFLEYEKTDFEQVKSFLRDANYRSYYAQRPNILCIPAEFDQVKIEGARSVQY
jgi:protein O-GlcNAc transferase